jgi:hypothetical protein
MSFVTTQTGALTAAAGVLENLGTSMADQNAATAAATTGVVPAAADPVSALQAAQFTAYGTWYQQVSAKAAAIHQMLVNTLNTSAGSYVETEGANQAAAGSTALSGATTSAATSSSTGAAIGTPFNYFQNVGAAASDFIALGQGQFLPEAVSFDPTVPAATGAPFMPAVPIAPAVATGAVVAGAGQASSVGRLSVPPSWAAGVPATNAAPATLVGAGWSGATPHIPSVTTMPAGMPSVASGGRTGYGFGAPRYGVKPTVMPKAIAV